MCFNLCPHTFPSLSFVFCCIPSGSGRRFKGEKGSSGPHGRGLGSLVEVCDPRRGRMYPGTTYPNEVLLGRAEGESRAAGWTTQPERLLQAEIQWQPWTGIQQQIVQDYIYKRDFNFFVLEKRCLGTQNLKKVLVIENAALPMWSFLNNWYFCHYQVKKTMSDLKEKLDCLVTYCTSSSETYKNLQDHMVRKTLTKASSYISRDICENMFEILRLTLIKQREVPFITIFVALVFHFIIFIGLADYKFMSISCRRSARLLSSWNPGWWLCLQPWRGLERAASWRKRWLTSRSYRETLWERPQKSNLH